MGKVIRIDDDVYRGLKQLAQPFEDTPNSVIRRLLRDAHVLPAKSHAGVSRGRSSVRPNPARTPQAAFRPVMLDVLAEMGGRAPAAEVLRGVEHRMRPRLTPVDYSLMASGTPRWQVSARWERQHMRTAGLLTGVRGLWELTDQGRVQLSQDRRTGVSGVLTTHTSSGEVRG